MLRTVKIIGWGHIDENNTKPTFLQNAQVNILPNELCYEKQNNSRKRKNFNNGFCVIGKNKETTCQGDSGSPVIWEDPTNNRAYLVGIAISKATPLHSALCGPFSEFPGKYIKIIDGESDSRHLLKYRFNDGKDFCQGAKRKPQNQLQGDGRGSKIPKILST